MSFSFRLRSHPDKLLIEHLSNVGKLSAEIVNSKHIKHKDILSKVAYLIGISHDFAKATTFFQDWLIDRKEQTEKARHGFLSSLLGYYLVKRYLLAVNMLSEFPYLPILTWTAIKRHHGNIQNLRWDGLHAEISSLDETGKELIQAQIKNIRENSLDELSNMYKRLVVNFEVSDFIEAVERWEELNREIRRDIIEVCREKDLKNFFIELFLYSVLLDADKIDASRIEIPQRTYSLRRVLVDEYKRIKLGAKEKSSINIVREMAYNEVNNSVHDLNLADERILSINLPTGMGKTLAVLSFSLGLRERILSEFGFAPRIIYCLPFLSIIDQNSEVIEEILKVRRKSTYIPSNLFLKHHHLSDVLYKEELDGELNLINDLNKAILLVEGWNSEIVITTFIQFFHSLITNRNRAARKFHNISNSIIVLDEVQSIPHKYWLLIKESLKLLSREFNCWIILMTATLPLIFEEGTEIKPLINNKTKYFEVFDRVDFIFDLDENGRFNEIEFDLFKSKVLDEVLRNKDKNLMFVLNTISSCKELYEFLKEKLSESYRVSPEKCLDKDGVCNLSDIDLINLSTNILPSFRLRRINKIKDKKRRKVIITTQLIEAGVDISVDVIYRDMAPLDCIIQTAGRCNRNNEQQKGRIYVICLKDKHARSFWSYVYDKFLVELTQEVIRCFGKTASEKDFVAKATEKYYSLIRARATEDESKRLLNNIMKMNFSEVAEFRLIEEKLPSISVFIEIDKEAEIIRREIQEILSLERGFKRKERLLLIRNKINENTVSVRYIGKTENIESLPILDKETFRYVSREELDKWYRLDTGFYISEEIGII